MQVIVGTTAIKLDGVADRGIPVIQNLGPGDVFLDTDVEATVTSGLRLQPGEAITLPSTGASETGIWVIATVALTDVRVVKMGEK